MSLDKKLIALGPAAPGTRTSDLGSDPFGDGNCICWIDFESSVEDETGTQTLTANGSITLTTDQVMFDTTSGYFDSTGAKDIPNKDSITFPAGDSGLSDIDGWTNSNDFSLSVWVYWEGLNNPSSEQQGVAAIAAITNGTGIMSRIYFGDQSNANKPAQSSFSDDLIGETALNVNAWNHLVFISPATDSSSEAAEIYLNGIRVGYETNWARGTRSYYDSIGATFNTVNNNSQYFNGYMDNLRIFKDRLTQSEVEQLYGEGANATYADFLVVAGGGGGGKARTAANGSTNGGPGAGGAGGLRTSYGSTSGGDVPSESKLTLIPGTTYTITVGAGGAGGSAYDASYGTQGVDSSIIATDVTTITTVGGGRGATGAQSANGGAGGSGGGSANGYYVGNGGAGTIYQGFDGGDRVFVSPYMKSGGGGGAAEPGNTDGPMLGGDGLAISITGSSVGYAGGGSGSDYNVTTRTSGGFGGGGDSGYQKVNALPGDTNTGGGGGAGGRNADGAGGNGGSGGSGVVILRMPTSGYSGTTTGSPTVTTDGSDTILKYTGSGTYVH